MGLVYSTQTGRIKEEPAQKLRPKTDGIVRIEKQTKGRKGKGVSVVTGLDLDESALKLLAAELKKSLGCGGAVKDFNIELQTIDREKVKQLLEKKQYKVKISGG